MVSPRRHTARGSLRNPGAIPRSMASTGRATKTTSSGGSRRHVKGIRHRGSNAPDQRGVVGPTRGSCGRSNARRGERRTGQAPVSRARSATAGTATGRPFRRGPALVSLGFDLFPTLGPPSILQRQWSKRLVESERRVQFPPPPPVATCDSSPVVISIGVAFPSLSRGTRVPTRHLPLSCVTRRSL